MFQSTPPYKRATDGDVSSDNAAIVSIHAPIQAGDCLRRNITLLTVSFNPRPHTSGRPEQNSKPHRYETVSIHAPIQAGDREK